MTNNPAQFEIHILMIYNYYWCFNVFQFPPMVNFWIFLLYYINPGASASKGQNCYFQIDGC